MSDEYTDRRTAEAGAEYNQAQVEEACERAVRWAVRKTLNDIGDYAMAQTDPVRLRAIIDLMEWMADKRG